MSSVPAEDGGAHGAPDTISRSGEDLAERLPVQVWTSLPDGQLDYVSEQTARSFGLTVVELLRHGWKDVVHPEDLPTAVERWTHALSTGETYEVEFRLRFGDGRYAWHLARAVPQRSADGAIVRWLGTNTDIEAQREERARLQALLVAVEEQAVESAAAIRALRAALEEARARLAELERLRHEP